jgi:hypothetical protein
MLADFWGRSVDFIDQQARGKANARKRETRFITSILIKEYRYYIDIEDNRRFNFFPTLRIHGIPIGRLAARNTVITFRLKNKRLLASDHPYYVPITAR